MATTTLMSFAEFERLEESPGKIELLKGEVIRMPPAYREHMLICERLFELLKAAVERLRQANRSVSLGKVHMEMGYRFQGEPASWLQPDVSLTHPDQPFEKFYIGAPLIAFEVVSASQTADDLNQKVSEYLANGAAEVWLIYPKRRHAWVYYGSGAARQEARAIQTPLLPSVEIPLDDILPPPVTR
jgi:Uma2 family endonuclease